jgi:hypothetical protein
MRVVTRRTAGVRGETAGVRGETARAPGTPGVTRLYPEDLIVVTVVMKEMALVLLVIPTVMKLIT